jgi:predicted transcriptional regulator
MKTTLPELSPELQNLLSDLAQRLGQSETEVITIALQQYARMPSDAWPRSIGMGRDSEVTGENSEDWLLENWHPD